MRRPVTRSRTWPARSRKRRPQASRFWTGRSRRMDEALRWYSFRADTSPRFTPQSQKNRIMRTASQWVLGLAVAITAAQAQTDQTVSTLEPVRTYTLLGEDEDWSFLKDPSLRQDPWDPLKYIPLGPDGWYLSIGGGMREALEQVGNDNWGKQPYTNTFFLERYVLHTDWHFGKHFRTYVELKSDWESFRKGGPRPIDEKKLDFEAAFVEVGAEEGNN